MIFGLLIALWADTVRAAPQISFPVNSQVPPVAQVSEAYEFTFTVSTFHTSRGPLSYSLANAPPWLHLENSTRTFYGTPKQEDVGPSVFQLVATDSSGLTTMDVTFVTLQEPVIRPIESPLSQLSQFGLTSNPDALFLHQLQGFAFSFSKATFFPSTNDITYYSTTDDASPLPSWLQFDPQDLSFFGKTPPLVSPVAKPQAYGIKLYASRVAGFAEATITFHLVVGYHTLAFVNSAVTVNVSRGDAVAISLKDQLRLDGNAIQDSDLSNAWASVPEWIRFDSRNISLWGNVPATVNDTNMTITATDFNGDVAATIVSLKVSKLFTGPFPMIDATAGQPFNYSINSDLLSFRDVKISVELEGASWLQYDDQTRTFRGIVPNTISPQLLTIPLHAERGSDWENGTLKIRIRRVRTSTSLSTFSSISSPTQFPSQSTTVTSSALPSSHVEDNSEAKRSRLDLVLLITLPILCSVLVAILLLACWRRKKARSERCEYLKKTSYRPRLITKELEAEEVSEKHGEPAAQSSAEERPSNQPVAAPRVDLPWTESTAASEEHLSRVLAAEEVSSSAGPIPGPLSTNAMAPVAISDNNDGQRPPNLQMDQPGHFVPRESYNFSRKRVPFKTLQSRIENSGIRKRYSKRYSRPISGFSPSNSRGLPTRRSGAGHGSGGPPGFNEVRQSWQHPRSSQSSGDSRVLSAVLDYFPQPPPEPEVETEKENIAPGKEPSMRLVNNNPAYDEFLRNRRLHKDLEPNARFSTMNSSRQFLDRRVPYSHLRSSRSMQSYSEIADYSTSESANWRQIGYSQSSSREPTIGSARLQRSSGNRLVARPTLPCSGFSAGPSGQLSSTESISDLEWEDDLLVESQDPGGRRRWYASAALSGGLSPGTGSLEAFRRSDRGHIDPRRAPNLQMSGPSLAGPGLAQATLPRRREWELRENRDQQPVSVVEGQMQRSQRSERGDLAFI